MIKKRILLIAIFLFLYSSLSLASDITPPVCEVTAKVLSVEEATPTDYKSMYIMKIEILSTGSIIQEGEPPASCQMSYNIGNINTVKIIKEKDLVDKDAAITEGMVIKGHLTATGLGIPPKYMTGPHPYIHIMKEVEIITEEE